MSDKAKLPERLESRGGYIHDGAGFRRGLITTPPKHDPELAAEIACRWNAHIMLINTLAKVYDMNGGRLSDDPAQKLIFKALNPKG